MKFQLRFVTNACQPFCPTSLFIYILPHEILWEILNILKKIHTINVMYKGPPFDKQEVHQRTGRSRLKLADIYNTHMSKLCIIWGPSPQQALNLFP